ncbi:MAG TPA: hypothetical protein VF208_08930 [Candidatus Binatia bacterium]|jgi:hypothetical protein
MDWIKAALLTGLLSTFMPHYNADLMAAEWSQGRYGCQRGDRLNIQDLDMSPDPVVEGQRIRAWRVRIDFSGRRDCETDVFIREGGSIVGHARNYRMRPGVNEVEIPVIESYRYTGREHCFNVQVDLDGSRQQVDATRRFCARQRTMWSMREPDDRGRMSLR